MPASVSFALLFGIVCGVMDDMTALPIRDRAGNELVDIRFVAERELDGLAEQVPMPASLVVVSHAETALLLFDSRRRQWELPGGMREPGEVARRAAIRELREETGIHVDDLAFAAVAEFELVCPDRRELLSVYSAHLASIPRLSANDEALAFRWWVPTAHVDTDMSPLDAEIARRVLGARPR